jgi:hypothetical protein
MNRCPLAVPGGAAGGRVARSALSRGARLLPRLSLCPRRHSFSSHGEWWNVFCFAKEEDAKKIPGKIRRLEIRSGEAMEEKSNVLYGDIIPAFGQQVLQLFVG